MFIVERQGSGPIVASSPEEAVQKFREHLAKEDTDNTYFDVWDTMSCHFYVICHNIDFDPLDPDAPEFEKVVHFTKAERTKLIEEMMYKAHCDDQVLRQLCEMAATQINTQDSYDDWIGEDIDEAHA